VEAKPLRHSGHWENTKKDKNINPGLNFMVRGDVGKLTTNIEQGAC